MRDYSERSDTRVNYEIDEVKLRSVSATLASQRRQIAPSIDEVRTKTDVATPCQQVREPTMTHLENNSRLV